ncbi:major facilitator superfamily domain-containing protein [Aspergillus oleicola]
MPVLFLLYLFAYIDKTNIGNAKIEGLLPGLGMSGEQYNVALAVFVPYVLAEVPSKIILNYFNKPSVYLGALIFIWGVIMVCTGFVRDFSSLVAIRFLLDLFEAGFLPGAILIISKWYLPNKTQTRIAILYTSAASGGVFSGILAFGIAKMDCLAGYEGWRWIFVTEDLSTILLAVMCFFLLLGSPSSSSRWLTPSEIRYLEIRQIANSIHTQQRETTSNLPIIISVLADWKIYLLILGSWSNAVPNYAMKFTMPRIIKGMGFSAARAQLLTIPPYAVGALSAYIFSVFSDKYTWRLPFIVVPQVLQVVAFSIIFTKGSDIEDNVTVCYVGVCLACFGPIYRTRPSWESWIIASAKRRAIYVMYLFSSLYNAENGLPNFQGTMGGTYSYRVGEGYTHYFACLSLASPDAIYCWLGDIGTDHVRL